MNRSLPRQSGAVVPGVPAYFFAAVSGLLLTAAFPRIDLDVMAAVALIPLLLTLREGVSFRHGFALGFTTGVVHNLTLMYWTAETMHTYGYLPWYLSVPVFILFSMYLALYPALFTALTGRLTPRPWMMPAAAAVFWTAMEFLRSHLLTGFPWALLGHALYDRPMLIQIADTFGVYGVSFLLVLVNGALAIGILAAGKRSWCGRPVAPRAALAVGGTTVVLVAAAVIYGAFRIQSIETRAAAAPAIRVAVIQGDIRQDVKWDIRFRLETTGIYDRLSLSAARHGADLIVWPETATPFFYGLDLGLTARVQKTIRTAGVPFLIGSPRVAPGPNGDAYYNSAYLIGPDARTLGRYDKVHLVPYGEYVPLRRWMPFIGKLVAQVGDFSAGRKGRVLTWDHHRLGPLICYELIFPELARAMVRNGAQLLVNITNDAWFGRSSAPFQHFSTAVFRAIETRRAVARAANTGISGFVDPAGRILDATPLMARTYRIHRLPLLNLRSPYVRIGDAFAWICLAATLAMAGAAVCRRRFSIRHG
jgi:apolipoprotein N-acyltransferase